MKPGLKRSLRAVLSILLLTVGSITLALLFLVGTETGTARLVALALKQVQAGGVASITVSGLEGTLASELGAAEINITVGATRISLGNVAVAWNPLALLDRSLVIRRVSLDRLLVRTGEADSGGDLNTQLGALFTLPVSIDIRQLDFSNIAFDAPTPVTVDNIAGQATLDQRELALDLAVRLNTETSVAGTLTLANDLALNGNLDWQAQLQGRTLRGNLVLAGTTDELTVTHQLQEPAAITSAGTITTGLADNTMPAIDLMHDTAGFDGSQFGVDGMLVNRATLRTTGTATSLHIDGGGSLVTVQLGNMQAVFIGTLADDILALDTFELNTESFRLDGSGSVTLGDAFALALDWRLRDFSDGDLLPQVQLENINGDGSITVNMNNGQTETQIGIVAIEGMLNGNALTGSGSVDLSGGSVTQVSVAVTSGGNTLQLDGGVEPALDLTWRLEAPVLERLLPDLSGRINGQGALTGTTAAPGITGTLAAQDLRYASGSTRVSLAAVSGTASYNGTENAIDLVFSGLGIATADINLQQGNGTIAASGTPASHDFRLTTRGNDPAVAISGSGGWLDGAWQGLLNSASVQSGYGNWTLEEPAQLVLSNNRADFGAQCWRMQDMAVCLDAAWREAQGLAGSLQLDNLPLAWFNRPFPAQAPDLEATRAQLATLPPGVDRQLSRYAIRMPQNVMLDGMLDLDMQFSNVGLAPDAITMAAHLSPRDLTFGLIREVDPENPDAGLQLQRYGLDDVMLEVGRSNGRWQLDSGFSIYLAEQGGLNVQGAFNGRFNLADDGVLGGDFDLTFGSIGWVEALAPMLRNVSGSLGAGGRISGNLSRPLLAVDARLDDGSMRMPEYGLALTDINLAFHSEGNNEMTLTGTASSGGGELRLGSDINTPFLPTRRAHVDVTGSNFLLVDLPDTRILIDPDLHFDFIDNGLDIGGSLHVPSMNLDLRNNQALVGNGGVAVSRDVVIINAQGNRETGSVTEQLIARIPVSGAVMLSVGDDVRFQGFGLDLRLAGGMMLEQTSDRPLLAHGELSIPQGSYSLYGQQLNIEDGKLLFLGNPLNPALDVRAVRQTSTAEVGLLMNGTVSHIQARLFSTPSLPESEILSLLITGNSFGSGTTLGGQEGQNMLGAIALLGLEKGQGLTNSVSSKLGLDTLAINSGGADYRESSLGLGKYISPNLFMRYDIGLFDRENVLTLQYILSQKLRLEVESGISQSVDLKYTFEK